VLKLKNDYVNVYYNRGILYGELKDYKNAVNDLTKAIKLNTDYIKAYNYRGCYEYRLGQKENACNDFKKGAELGDTIAQKNLKKYCNN